MQVKKFISSFLVVSFLSLLAAPISAEAPKTSNQNLYDFLKNTENITASYTYPSMKLSSATSG
ncbi:MAG: hypothetical protein PHX18_02545 [Candidatus Gastranaerophilales bacterium]|nr:hypothetical protein [Candidatus Gastranaerophilales bacterium]